MHLRCVKTEKKLYAIEAGSIIKVMPCSIGSGNHKLTYEEGNSPAENGYVHGGKEGDWITPIGNFKLGYFHYNASGFYTKIENTVFSLGLMKIDLNCKNEKGNDKGIRIHHSKPPVSLSVPTHGCIRLNEDDMGWLYDHSQPGDKIIIESTWASIVQQIITEEQKNSDLNITMKQTT